MTKTNLDAVKEETTEQFDDVLESVSSKTKDMVDCASERAQDACCTLTRSVRQKPLVYLGFALAVGIALGAVFLCRRSD